MGVIGAAGWYLAHGGLAQPVASFPPVSLVESIGILFIGLSLAFAAADKRQLVALGGVVVLSLGFFALARQLFGPGQVSLPVSNTTDLITLLSLPLSSALLFIGAGAGLLGLALPSRTDRSRLTAGAFGAIEAVLCLGLLATRFMWRPDAQSSLLVGSSFHLLISTLLLGLCLGLITWSSDPDTASNPWVPLTVGLACLVTAIFLWRALITYEEVQVLEQTRVAARSARMQIGRQVEAAVKVLTRLARFTPVPWPKTRDRENTAVTLTRDVDGLMAIAWLDSAGVVRRMFPAASDSEPLRTSLSQFLNQELSGQSGGQSDVARFFPLERPGRFAMALPFCGSGQCRGYVAGIFEADRMLAPVVADSGSGFNVTVAVDRREVVGPAARAPAEWIDHSNYSAGKLVWDIYTWPSEATMARMRSGLPDLLLLLGLLVSTLLPLAIRLGQLNLSRARVAERARVNTALETATDGIWEWDVGNGTARRSSALWRHLGYDPGAMGTGADTWSSLIHPTDQPRVMNAFSDHLSGLSQTFEARYRIRSHAGDWHWIIDRGRVVERSPTGQPRRVLGITADVTDRQRADEALAASERRFRACFDSAFQLQLLLDGEGRILEANRAALEFVGLELPVIRGKAFWELPTWQLPGEVIDGKASQIQADVQEALAGRPVRREMEINTVRGEFITLDLAYSPIADGNGNVTQLLVDARDMTLRKRAEDVLREVESLTTMGRMAARVAHEINNPLAGIQNAFLLIKDAVPTSHPHHSYVGAVEREITRIAGVTRQLYETYRPEQNGQHGTSVQGLVSDAVSLLEQVNRASGVKIEVNLTDLPPTIQLPETIVRQSLYNLVQNAVEASPPGGTVEVAATVADSVFILRVSDRGPGIPAEIRERVFEPFFTTKSAAVRTGGMGLGLSLVGRSVQALGGQVEIHDREGGGTEFVVRLPIPSVTSGVMA